MASSRPAPRKLTAAEKESLRNPKKAALVKAAQPIVRQETKRAQPKR